MKTLEDMMNFSDLDMFDWQIELLKDVLGSELTKPRPVLAVDGDILAFRTAAVCEEEFEGSCNAIIDATIRDIVNNTGISLLRFYLSGHSNFRFDAAKTKPYKGNRDSFVKPKFLGHCKNYLVTKYKAVWIETAEADDGIASDMTLYGAIHCGIDKDLLQIPGRHYNYVNKEFIDVDEDTAKLNLYRQVLMGDSSDNIPGLPGVGVKTAEKVIWNAEQAEEHAIEFYKQKCAEKLPEVNAFEYMAEQLSLIKMLTNRDDYVHLENTVYIRPQTDGFEAQDGDFKEFQADEKQLALKGL